MKNSICIVGAGLVGSLLALILKKEGFEVEVFEKRDDPRNTDLQEGRSINLALSDRGIKALKTAGIFEEISSTLIPMQGRMMHDLQGELTFQSYGSEEQFINSVSRAQLNIRLIDAANKAGVKFHFGQKCTAVDLDAGNLTFEKGRFVHSKVIIGADGAFSVIRKSMESRDRFNFSQYYIEHGYKELSIYPVNGEFAIKPNYLHIWPRGNYMLIALPNNDKTFTCTLFLPFEGEHSFAQLETAREIETFFESNFPDAKKLIPDLVDQFTKNPTGSMVTTKSEPWNQGNCLLIGDAAHAIVPFYGQGMNAGFEDVSILLEMGRSLDWNWERILHEFPRHRKKDADAISALALHNFKEMRDHVAHPNFLKKKEIEAELQKRYPNEWIPLYSMVTFSDMPYSEAHRLGNIQAKIMEKVISKNPEKPDYAAIVNEFNTLKTTG